MSGSFSLAVREIEAWALADREALADFMGVKQAKIPEHPDGEEDPTVTLVHLARSREPKRRTFLRSPSMVDPIDLIAGGGRRDAGAPRRASVDRPRDRQDGTTGSLVHRGLTSRYGNGVEG